MADDLTPVLSQEQGTALSDTEIGRWLALPSQQQPGWAADPELPGVRRELSARSPLVGWEEVRTLNALLAGVAEGKFQVIQAGDCAEEPAECAAVPVSRKIGLLDALAGVMQINVDKPLIRVGRIAGQFAKPRSEPMETVDGVQLPVYRGHLVNSPEPEPDGRRADPRRMLDCYEASQRAMGLLRGRSGDAPVPMDALVWTSHEALVLDYELPMVRRSSDGKQLLTSTHWPWIGERTRQPDGAHVRLLGSVINPVSCKVGPNVSAQDVVELCRLLDPERTPGKLTLIARMGADVVTERLPRLVSAVAAAGHPVIWMCDPMHGNTVRGPGGVKTRLVKTMRRELQGFLQAVDAAGGVAGGLHLESTPHNVTECIWDETELPLLRPESGPLCDPRLNPWQALAVATCWEAPADAKPSD